MLSPRSLVSFFAVVVTAGLIGCGGEGTTPSFGDDPTTSTTSGDVSAGGGGGSTDLRAPAGSYGASFSGNDGTTTFTGTGTGTAASDGTITLNLAAADTSNATARSITAVVATTGAVTSGTATVGAAGAASVTAGTLARQSDGSYRLSVTFVNAASVTETDVYTLRASTAVYVGPNTGTDNQGTTYSGSGTGTVTSGNVLTLFYTSRRSSGVVQNQSLSTTLLIGGTFSGTLSVNSGARNPPVTGTWVLGTDTNGVPTLTLRLTYLNETYVNGGTNQSPTVTERLVLVKQLR